MVIISKYISMIFVLAATCIFPVEYGMAQGKAGEQSQVDREMHRTSTEALIVQFESPDRKEWQKPDEVIAMLGDLTDKAVMDIGAGSGYFTFRLAMVAQKVIAADVDERFIKYLNRRRDSLSLDNVEVRSIPYNSPGLRPDEVDAVLIVDTYHHIENRVDYLRKLKKGIRPGGELLIVDFKLGNGIGPPDRHKLKPEQVLKELREAGYSNIKMDMDTLPYQYIIKTVI